MRYFKTTYQVNKKLNKEQRKARREGKLKSFVLPSVIMLTDFQYENEQYDLMGEITKEEYVAFVINWMKENSDYYKDMIDLGTKGIHPDWVLDTEKFKLSGEEEEIVRENLESYLDRAFSFVKENRMFLNTSSIEKECKITRTSLTNAINRKQKKFRDTYKLIPFLQKKCKWDLKIINQESRFY